MGIFARTDRANPAPQPRFESMEDRLLLSGVDVAAMYPMDTDAVWHYKTSVAGLGSADA